INMGVRGRVSAAQLAIVGSGKLETIERPKPLAHLIREQALEWNEVVSCQPADWFGREHYGILEQYCRHVVSSRHIAELIRDFESSEEFDVDGYNKLLIMQEREGR